MNGAFVLDVPAGTPGFTKLYNAAIESGLTGDAFKLLAAMLLLNSREKNRKDGKEWHFSIGGMCVKMSWGRKRIKSALVDLIDKGFSNCKKQGRAEAGNRNGGQFQADYYEFYAVPSLNPKFNQNASENSENKKDGNCEDLTVSLYGTPVRNAVGRNNIRTLKEKKSFVLSLSVSPETTDGLNEEPTIILSPDNSEQFTILEELITTYSDCDSAKQELKAFIPEITRYLENSVESESMELEEIISKLKEIISKEGSLFAFIKKVKHECEKALKKLKYPSAKENYLTSTIRNQLKKYSPKSPELDKHSEPVPKKQASESKGSPLPSRSESEKESSKTLNFREMLFYMGSPLLKENPYHADTIFSSEEEFKSYYGEFDPDEWAVRDCWIPDFFQNNPHNFENALRFLTGYSDLPSDSLEQSEYKEFVGKTIHLLAKALYTKKTSYSGKEILNTDTLISRLNYINVDMNDHEDSLRQFMRSFYERFKRKIAQYPVQTNEESYITLMLVNYLNGEYQAEDMIGIGKGMAMLDSFK